MRTRFFDYLYWVVITLWITANAVVFVKTRHPPMDRGLALIWILVAYSLWRRWRRAQRAGEPDDPGA